jgi:glycosyltransferase involved in cell wall biosynthesis
MSTISTSRTGVLLLARHLDLGGTERQLSEMAQSLDRRLFDVHVGCFRSGGIRARDIAASGIPITELPLRSFKSPSNVTAAIRALRRYVDEHGIAIVHAFDPPAVLFAGVAASFVRPAAVLTSQRCFRETCTPMFRRALRAADRMADGVVVNCEALRRHRLALDGREAARLHLCHNGLDTTRFQRRVPSPAADAVPPGSIVVGSVCGLRPEKGLPTLVSAFAQAAVRHPRLFLLLVGDGTEREALTRQADALGLQGRYRFQPKAADVVPWLSLIDIFVLPSAHNEALSNALMEAMACGCAVVASRGGGNTELVLPGETGLLFEPRDAASLAGHLERLAADPGLRQQMGRGGAAYIQTRFSLGAAAERMGSIYVQILEQYRQAA